jgi:hypothetical protein
MSGNKQLCNLIRTLTKPSRGKGKRKGKSKRRGGSMAKSAGPQGLLAGYGSPITTTFMTTSIGDGLVVRGFDLVTSFELGQNISYYITANPAAWNGTRIAGIASAFQNYRPKKFIIHYRPQVGSTDGRSLFIGTIWQTNYITNRSSLEPSCLTSPGGVYTPAWQSATTVVNLATNLPQRMFPLRDPEQSTVPFAVFCRASTGGPSDVASDMPGRIFIEYEYEFRNAIGASSNGFQPSRVGEVIINMDGSISPATLVEDMRGTLVDLRSASGDAAFSDLLPFNARFSVDRYDNGAGVNYQALVNGNRITLTSQVIAFVYTDDGRP